MRGRDARPGGKQPTPRRGRWPAPGGSVLTRERLSGANAETSSKDPRAGRVTIYLTTRAPVKMGVLRGKAA